MSGGFTLTHKLAIAGGVCGLAVMAVGSKDDPGIVTSTKDTVHALPKHVAKAEPQSPADYWRVTPGSVDPQPTASLAPPTLSPPEKLPPGFGATPSPDLPK